MMLLRSPSLSFFLPSPSSFYLCTFLSFVLPSLSFLLSPVSVLPSFSFALRSPSPLALFRHSLAFILRSVSSFSSLPYPGEGHLAPASLPGPSSQALPCSSLRFHSLPFSAQDSQHLHSQSTPDFFVHNALIILCSKTINKIVNCYLQIC